MQISCPVSAERVNENIVRMIAFMVALIGVVCLIFSNYWAMIFLIFDFYLRAFTTGKYSLLKWLALQIAKIFPLTPKMTDAAPKKFAATLGFTFSLIVAAFYFLNFQTIADVLAFVLVCFALLESVLAICVGCYVYSYWNILFKRN
ncbi:DUF4395 domain-containing protein [Pedobacter mucosus]|uniref:DUF4395 domain-containing protein n=1 Tax=Pedobacter mucosus TaxID=2895286 RepID=UPI001EE4496C|nr:DUF4395 domain-containing protein [Pedobacter mucosus]UKT64612.1 DUF4395 domain-containing protein [Pedobacter mucosus]